MHPARHTEKHERSTRSPIALVFAGIASVALVTAGCRAVLGLDEPTLDPCIDGCADGEAPDASDATQGQDGAPDTTVTENDAGDGAVAIDAPAEATAPIGVQCGPGTQATYCTAAAPVCCRKNGDASVIYTCVSGVAACAANGDYDIQCSGASNCGAGQVCCHYNSAMKCESVKDCLSGGDRVCDPSLAADCADGSTCSRQLPSLPYFACSP